MMEKSIFSTMKEKENVKSLLYFGLQEKTCAKRRLWEFFSIPVYRCARKGKIPGGRLQYFYAPVPEFYVGPEGYEKPAGRGSRLISASATGEPVSITGESDGHTKPGNRSRHWGWHDWKAEKLSDCLQETIERVRPDDCYVHPRVRRMLGAGAYEELPPMPLLEAMLYEKKGFHSLDIVLPPESRTGVMDTLIHLLNPYLARINTISVVGEEEGLFAELEDYFYGEYGIVVNRAKRAGKNGFILNLWSGAEETLKFLDTMVKNGYNTKVN